MTSHLPNRAGRLPHPTARHRLVVLVALGGLAASGCVTEKKMQTYVEDRVTPVETRVDGVESQVEANQTRIDEQQEQLADVSETAREAYERAVEAGKLAEGKLLYERTLSDADVRFGLESSSLSDGAHGALDAFAAELKQQGVPVYIEIQGHTDSTGSDDYNMELGQQRADAVRQYLNREHALPLHRMNVVSYGESKPVADNTDREGRGQNRRVVLVVLQ
ncbi:MAG: OmpA family protein [Acidobacteriota bacterium]